MSLSIPVKMGKYVEALGVRLQQDKSKGREESYPGKNPGKNWPDDGYGNSRLKLSGEQVRFEKLQSIEEKTRLMGDKKRHYEKRKHKYGRLAESAEADYDSLIAEAEKCLKALDDTTESCSEPKTRRLRRKVARKAEESLKKASFSEKRLNRCYGVYCNADANVQLIEMIIDELKNRHDIIKDGEELNEDYLAEFLEALESIDMDLLEDGSSYDEKEINRALSETAEKLLNRSELQATDLLGYEEVLRRVDEPEFEDIRSKQIDQLKVRLNSHLHAETDSSGLKDMY
ncbi:MAG: hypothetical protein AB3K77_00885 [Methanosarcinaceae archaeon]